MTSKRELGMGNIQATLIIDSQGTQQTVILKPSLHAMRTLSRKYSGLQAVLEKVLRVDFDVMVDVFEVGMQLPLGNPKARSELEQSLYLSGVLDQEGGLVAVATNFINVLLHGGKPPPLAGTGEVPQPPNPPNAS